MQRVGKHTNISVSFEVAISAVLIGNFFIETKLINAVFTGVNFTCRDFASAVFYDVKFISTVFVSTYKKSAVLSNVYFIDAVP